MVATLVRGGLRGRGWRSISVRPQGRLPRTARYWKEHFAHAIASGFSAYALGAAKTPLQAAILGHNIGSGKVIKVQGDRIPVQASVQADGVGTSFVSFAGFAGFGSLVGVTSDWAFGFTVKTPADVTTLQYFIADASSGGSSQAIYIYLSNGTLVFLILDGVTNYGGSFAVQANTIYRVLGSFLYSDKKLRIYKDGVLQVTGGALAANLSAGINFNLFRFGDYAGNPAGSGLNLCDVVVYGEYLDATGAAQEYAGTFTATQALKARWKMNEGTGTALDDSGPSGHDGVMNGGLTWNAAGTPLLSETATWAASNIFHTIASPAAHRYWRMLIESPAGTETMVNFLLAAQVLNAAHKDILGRLYAA